MEKDTQSRKWQITINNPKEKALDHVTIRNQIAEITPVVYWCMSDEIGEEGTYHTHLFIACSSAVRFSSLQRRFKGAHFEMANGTSQQNRDYVFKLGKWEKSKKKETNLPDTQEEWGDMPLERQGTRTDLADLYDMIKEGITNYEIIEQCPQYLFNIDKLERARQLVREQEYRNKFRTVNCVYIYGKTGVGKTRSVMESHGYTNVFRVTDYDHPFDGYRGQETVLFEEFRSSLKIQDMLNYLDGYPLELPCRYANKVACFTQVYIISNIAFNEQYKSVQKDHPETWAAFCRRIDYIKEMGDMLEISI